MGMVGGVKPAIRLSDQLTVDGYACILITYLRNRDGVVVGLCRPPFLLCGGETLLLRDVDLGVVRRKGRVK